MNKNIIVLSSPSGGGKSTVARYLLEKYPNIAFSISCTTRSIRGSEINGKEYYFLTKDEFNSKIQNDEFVEWEEIFGNYYGTLRSEIDRIVQQGKKVLFDVDVKGAISLKNNFDDDSLLIFISPPSLEVLEERLRKRGTETEEQIQNRIQRFDQELDLMDKFDYVVVNDKLQDTLTSIDIIGNLFGF